MTCVENGRLLPQWWTAEKKEECLSLGKSGGDDARPDLNTKVDKTAINQRYGDEKFAMQLRMFADAVYGRGVGGSDGTMMRKMLVAAEAGRGPNMSHVSLGT